ncbi:GAF domain-containing protein [Streptomyces sp. Ac-502]|uniref:GAF domain-containing protein n=1 Tax=Streptomyces sp. Ac-502 TaxID=3342801 RepID=UPI003862A6F9
MPGRDHPARHIGEACRTALHGCYSVGITLAVDATLAQRVSQCAAGPLANRGAALQINLGAGLRVQALRQRAPVLADDLDGPATTRQWPAYAQQAATHRIRAVFALPLLSGPAPAQRAGIVLTLYREQPGPIADCDLQTARDHADAAELLLLSAPAPSEDDLAHAWLVDGTLPSRPTTPQQRDGAPAATTTPISRPPAGGYRGAKRRYEGR